MEIQDSSGAQAGGDVAKIGLLTPHDENCVDAPLPGRAEADGDSCVSLDETLGDARTAAEQHHMLKWA